jgi:hypothetical protein
MQNNQSEIRMLLQQVEQEYQAAQAALHGYAITSSHEFITARLENMGRLHEHLEQMVGADAIRLIAECLEVQPETKQSRKG